MGAAVATPPSLPSTSNAIRRDASQVGGALMRPGSTGEMTTVPDVLIPDPWDGPAPVNLSSAVVERSPALQGAMQTAALMNGGAGAAADVAIANGGNLAPGNLRAQQRLLPAAAGAPPPPPPPGGGGGGGGGDDIDLSYTPGAGVDYGDFGVSSPGAGGGGGGRGGRRRRRGAPAPADAGVAAETSRRGWFQGVKDTANLYTMPADLGMGDAVEGWIKGQAGNIKSAAGRTAVQNLGGLIGGGLRIAPYVGAVLPTLSSAASGMENGPGGAMVSGGITAAGSLIGGGIGFALGGPAGAAIGAGIGGSAAAPLADSARQGVAAMVDAGKGGDTGFTGQLGRAIDPFFTSESERMGYQQMAQLNSPAVIAVQQEAERRNAKARNDQLQAMYLQSLMS